MLADPDIATCMYYTGIDPFGGEQVFVAQHLRDRKLQRALLQFFKPENYFEVPRGEKPGERGLQQHGQKEGYRPGRKSQQRKKRGK